VLTAELLVNNDKTGLAAAALMMSLDHVAVSRWRWRRGRRTVSSHPGHRARRLERRTRSHASKRSHRCSACPARRRTLTGDTNSVEAAAIAPTAAGWPPPAAGTARCGSGTQSPDPPPHLHVSRDPCPARVEREDTYCMADRSSRKSSNSAWNRLPDNTLPTTGSHHSCVRAGGVEPRA
jgi:hypothetical protein